MHIEVNKRLTPLVDTRNVIKSISQTEVFKEMEILERLQFPLTEVEPSVTAVRRKPGKRPLSNHSVLLGSGEVREFKAVPSKLVDTKFAGIPIRFAGKRLTIFDSFKQTKLSTSPK
jgi:hypothetical protein